MAIFWRDAMSVGVPELDADHKKLIALINATEKVTGPAEDKLLRGILQELVAYVDNHFKREEATLAALKVPSLEAHRKLHEAMAQRAKLLRDKELAITSAEERRKLTAYLSTMLNDWLLTHVFKEDMKLKPFARLKLQAAEGGTGAEAAMPTAKPERNRDVTYVLPPDLAHLLTRIEYQAEKLPPPEGDFASFDALCAAAICRRVDRVVTFFHRGNPEVKRPLPPIFLLSPAFAAKFRDAITKFILPNIRDSRQVRMLSTSFDWSSADTDSFWDFVTPQLKSNILDTWAATWEDLKLVDVRKDDGTRVLQVKEPTKQLREMLHPDQPEDYDLPRIANREIDIFKSLLDPATDWWVRLNNFWQCCHDLYEQEKEPRAFQQKAREGALRDNLLNAFVNLPEQWGDFVILTCHRVFPRIDSQFLEKFSTNLGRNEHEREAHMPFLIRYLRQVREHPNVRRLEQEAEHEWEEQERRLRKFFKENPPTN